MIDFYGILKLQILIFFILLTGCSTEKSKELVLPSMEYAELFKITSDSSELHIFTNDSSENPYFRWKSDQLAKHIVCLSTTHLSYLDVIDQNEKVAGFSDLNDIFDQKLKSRLIKQGVVTVGMQGSDTERIINLQPDLIIFSTNSDLSNISHLRELNFSRMPFLTHLEKHPLGRLEWVKCIGMVTGALAESGQYFNSIAQNYEQLVKGNSQAYTTFFVGYDYNNSWYVAGGKSYMAQFIKDAGGQYLLENDQHSGSFTVSQEHAFELLSQADVWLHPGYGLTQYDQIKHGEVLKDLIKPEIRVYNNNLRMNQHRSNDFWQSGIVRPDLVLKDLINITSEKKDSLIYYRRLK